MRECLDESMLQSFVDGELSQFELEGVSSHLTHCQICSVAARELANENELVTAALAPEFEAAVPSERLRRRIDAAVAGLTFETNQTRSPLFERLTAPFSALFAFRQPAFGFGALAAVLLFATVAGMIYFRTNRGNPALSPDPQSIAVIGNGGSNSPVAVAKPVEDFGAEDVKATEARDTERPRVPRVRRVANRTVARVKLLPGERSYLKTIAALDSTIKANERPMRPALQAEYERNLALVDRALAAARNAAKNNPNDPDAAEFVFAAYQSKVDLLNTVADARVYNRQQ